MSDEEDDYPTTEPEYQHATITVGVVFPVHPDDDEDSRKSEIARRFRLDTPDGIDVKPGIRHDHISLNGVESMKEYNERKLAKVEGEHLRKIEKQKERYFDRHGHF